MRMRPVEVVCYNHIRVERYAQQLADPIAHSGRKMKIFRMPPPGRGDDAPASQPAPQGIQDEIIGRSGKERDILLDLDLPQRFALLAAPVLPSFYSAVVSYFLLPDTNSSSISAAAASAVRIWCV